MIHFSQPQPVAVTAVLMPLKLPLFCRIPQLTFSKEDRSPVIGVGNSLRLGLIWEDKTLPWRSHQKFCHLRWSSQGFLQVSSSKRA